MAKEFFKSILAGIMVAIASYTQTQIVNKYVAAFLFAVALIVICVQEYNLFTGKIGYVKTKKQAKECSLWLIGNFIGVAVLGNVFNPVSQALVETKLAIPLYMTFWNACWCGLLMYMAVSGFKKKSYLSIVYCIPTFILAGFEHCIADAYHIIAARAFTFDSLIFILIVILGNIIGAQLAHLD